MTPYIKHVPGCSSGKEWYVCLGDLDYGRFATEAEARAYLLGWLAGQ